MMTVDKKNLTFKKKKKRRREGTFGTEARARNGRTVWQLA